MQEVFSKIIEKLEEKRRRYFLTIANTGDEKLDCAYEYVGDALDKAIEIVKQEAEQYNNGWIPCSERLPEKYNRVLAHTDAGGYYIAHVNGCGKFVCTAECVSTVIENSDVIAWQPLPDPYQPVSNDSTDASTRYEKSAWRDLILRNFMRGSDA